MSRPKSLQERKGFSINLPTHDLEVLEKVARRKDLTIAYLVRQMVAEGVRRLEAEEHAGAAHSPPS